MNNRKQMERSFKSRLRQYEKSIPNMPQYISEEYLQKDKAIVELNINAGYQVFSKLAPGNQLSLNSEIISYIDEKVYPIPAAYPVILRVHGISDEKTQSQFRHCVKEHYYLGYEDKKIDMKLNTFKNVILFTFGSCLMILYFFMTSFVTDNLFNEIASIAATVVIWSAFESILFDRRQISRDCKYAGQLATMEVEFQD